MAKGKKTSTVEVAAALAQPILEELGLRLWDLRFEKEGSVWYLRFLLDRLEGTLTIEDCEIFSRAVEKRLDEADPIQQSYVLEVSSPGIERELTRDWHFDHCMGQEVLVRLIRPVEGERDFVGVLTGWDGTAATLQLSEDLEMRIEKGEAAYIRLYYDFEGDQNASDGGEDEE